MEFLKNNWISDMKNKYAPSNINKKKNILSVFSNYLIIEGIISENKIKLISNIKNDVQKIEVYSEDELKSIFEYMDNKIKEDNFQRKIDKQVWMLNRLIVKIIYDNALRISEAVGIKLEDINLEEGNKFYIRGKGHNGNVSRFNVFKKETVELLKEYLNLRTEIKIKDGNQDYLFISPLSKSKITDNSLRKFFKKILDELNIDYNSPMHDIRHSKLTELIEKGAEVKKVSMYAGHTSERITEKYYIHQTDKVMEELSEL
jgi:site-specific recombinase XerD